MIFDFVFGAFAVFFVAFFFGLCIIVHELGHFLAAKWRGLHIIAFSIGFKKVWGKKINGVEYRIGCLPFGGYVDIPQIDASGEAKTEDGKPLPPAKPLDRIITAFAGPLFNILFGVLLGVFLWIYGIPQDTPKMRSIEVAWVDDASPEYKAGLRKDDLIYSINGKRFYSTWNDIVQEILFTVGDVKLGVKREGQPVSVVYKPAENPNILKEEKIAYPFFLPKIPVVINPLPDSPAARAGLKKDDIVLKVNNVEVTGYEEFADRINECQGTPVRFTIDRNGRILEVSNIIPLREKQEGEVYRIGVKYEQRNPVVISEVLPGSAADAAGLKPNDVILRIDGRDLRSPESFYQTIQKSRGAKLAFTVARDGKVFDIDNIVPRLLNYYSIGIQLIFYNHPNPLEQFVDVMDKTYKSIRGIISPQSTIKARNMSGPIGIVRVMWITVYKAGIIHALYLIVVITYSLAVFNLFPIPVLDGGHILLACIETVFRRQLPEWVLRPIIYLFLTLLISLMLFVSFYDVKRVFGSFEKHPAAKNGETRQVEAQQNYSGK